MSKTMMMTNSCPLFNHRCGSTLGPESCRSTSKMGGGEMEKSRLPYVSAPVGDLLVHRNYVTVSRP